MTLKRVIKGIRHWRTRLYGIPNDPFLKKNLVDRDFRSAERIGKRFKAWYAIVEYDPKNEDVPWKFLSRIGF